MARSPLGGLRILVAEDEYMLAMDLRRDPMAQGAVVIGPAPSLEKVVDLIEDAGRIDGALLDVNLNGEPVFPAADLLRERRIPFLFVTGYDRSSIPAGFTDVRSCLKPMENGEVIAAWRK